MQILKLLFVVVLASSCLSKAAKNPHIYLGNWITESTESELSPYMELTDQSIHDLTFIPTDENNFDVSGHFTASFRAKPTATASLEDVVEGTIQSHVTGRTEGYYQFTINKLTINSTPEIPKVFQEELQAYLDGPALDSITSQMNMHLMQLRREMTLKRMQEEQEKMKNSVGEL